MTALVLDDPSIDFFRTVPVHFDIYNQFFNLVMTGGLIQTDEPAAQHGHAYTHHLPGAKVSVGYGGTF